MEKDENSKAVNPRLEARAGAVISYPEELPISARMAEIREMWRRHQVIIVCGATGSGKTTQLPKAALELGCGSIGCTQPRRIAALAMARRLAGELQVPFGEGVGCKMRFQENTSPATFLKFMTDGILLAESRSDKLLKRYDALIIDEAHERSLNIDFLLGLLKLICRRRRYPTVTPWAGPYVRPRWWLSSRPAPTSLPARCHRNSASPWALSTAHGAARLPRRG